MKRSTYLLVILFLAITTNNLFAVTKQGHFRWRNDDGSETTATWKAAQNTNIQVDKGVTVRLRIEFYNDNPWTDGNTIYLAYSTSSSASGGAWTKIDETSALFQLSETSNFADQDLTTNQLAETHETFAAGVCLESTSLYYLNLNGAQSKELEYSIKPTTSAVQGTTYYFAIFVNNGDNINEYSPTLPGLTVTVDGSLPVTLSSFSGSASSKGVSLNWSTSAEIENQGFIIDRIQNSEDSSQKEWQEIASFTSNKALEGQGSTTKTTDYTFSDTQVEDGMTYSYRLSDVDYKGIRVDHDEMIRKITFVTPAQTVLPGVFELMGLYPNPFNPSTTLSYNLSETTDLNVGIYNMQGVLVWYYTYENHPAGDNYKLSWNGRDLSGKAVNSGIYLVNIRADGQNLTQKVTLLR